MLMRERVAIVLITLSVVATLVLGGATAYELGKSSSDAVGVAQTIPGTGGASSSSAAGAGAQDTASLPAAGQSSGAQPAAGSSTGGGGSGATGAAPGAPAARTGTGPGTGPAAGKPASAPAGVANGVITVGGIFDETGPFDATTHRDTVRAYFNEVNAAGGVNGYKLQLIDCDSGFDPTRAHQCSDRLINQGILALVGSLSVSGEQAEVPYLASRGVPVIGGLGVPAEFQSPLSYPVSVNILAGGVDALAAHAKDLGIQHPAILVINSPVSAPGMQSLIEALHRQGIQEKSADLVEATKPDYTDIAVKLRLEGADSVIGVLDPFSYARMFQAFERQGYHPKILCPGLDKPSAEKQYGQAVYGAESLTWYLEPDEHLSLPAMSEYLNTVQRYYPNQVAGLDVYTEGGWIAAKVFVEALRRIHGPVTPASLVTALNSIRNFDTGLTVPLSYFPGAAHDPNKCVQWIRNQQGTWHTYSGWNCF
jgi:branched-chain amino acid transport system substrate-binding protein